MTDYLYLKRAIDMPDVPSDRTIGHLYVDGFWKYWTLEDVDRHLENGGIKIPKETAIPRGRYRVIIDQSVRFKCEMPHILDVPQFTGIRFHDGGLIAEPIDTEGCIIPGMRIEAKTCDLYESKAAFQMFTEDLRKGLEKGEVWITIA